MPTNGILMTCNSEANPILDSGIPTHRSLPRGWVSVAAIAVVCASSVGLAWGSSAANGLKAKPWMNPHLSPDQRADLVVREMTLDEKIQLVHGSVLKAGPYTDLQGKRHHALGGDGFVPGIPRLGIPDLQLVGAGVGVTNLGLRTNAEATALPSSIAETATWDTNLARDFGTVIGRETRDQGFNVSLGGGIDLTREPRNGRNFEYHGEDPLLAGEMDGAELKAIQAQDVIADIKHYAVNVQESGRTSVSSNIDKRSMREEDLLAFEIAIQRSNVGTVMCSYNRVNDIYACENKYLLTDVLKNAWGYKGWVMSDWGATHSTVAAALAGLDQEFFSNRYFAAPLRAAIEDGQVPMSRLDDMVHRILRTMFAFHVIDNPPVITPIDFHVGAIVAQHVEENGCVLLKNRNHLLPLDSPRLHTIAVIGSHADTGVLSGGGSSQVEPEGMKPIPPTTKTGGVPVVWDPSSPLKAIAANAPDTKVMYNDGKDAAAAAKLAKTADVAIVFVHQVTQEGTDLTTLELSDNQDGLVRQVAAANPHIIVVGETGGAFLMPWIDQVGAVLQVWYPGIRGGQAIAAVLFGQVNPSGKLPITFPKSDADLPHPVLYGPLPGGDKRHPKFFDVNYAEGLKVGYKWYDAEKKEPLFPFGFGLSYTTFAYFHLQVTSNNGVSATFDIKNKGGRAGAEVAEIYLALPNNSGEPPKRLVGWKKVMLQAGEARSISVKIQPRMLAIFDVVTNAWKILPGDYRIYVGSSSRQLPLQATFSIGEGETVP